MVVLNNTSTAETLAASQLLLNNTSTAETLAASQLLLKQCRIEDSCYMGQQLGSTNVSQKIVYRARISGSFIRPQLKTVHN
jgi:hypothetical protein